MPAHQTRSASEVASVIVTERNPAGQITAEFKIERHWHYDRIACETVRETRYDASTGELEFHNRAVEPSRARDLIARAAQGGMLDRWDD